MLLQIMPATRHQDDGCKCVTEHRIKSRTQAELEGLQHAALIMGALFIGFFLFAAIMSKLKN